MKTFENIKDKVPMLPWIEIAREIVDGVNRTDEPLDSAHNMMSIEDLHHYIKQWRTDCQSVNKVIQWELFGEDGSKKLAMLSRTGAYEQPFLY